MPDSTRRKVLQISSYPPPRSGWGVRVQFLKQYLEEQGHVCVVLNTGTSRRVPSPEYETVLGGLDYVRKVWKYTRAGFTPHVHVNGKSPKGLALGLLAEALAVVNGQPPALTFHAGEDQLYFPRAKAPTWVPVFKLLFRWPKFIVCNSEGVRQRIAEYGVPLTKVKAIPAFSRQYLQFTPVTLGAPVETFWRRFDHVFLSYMNIRRGYYPETLLAAFAQVITTRADAGLVICGMLGHREPELWQAVQEKLADRRLRDRVCLVDDFDHDQFLTALSRATCYVRTPPEDGVSSSVLEALALRTPVVAAWNSTRPAGVLTYPATDVQALTDLLEDVMARRSEIAAAMPLPDIPDTLSEEARLLTS